MTITPDHARELLDVATPGPWGRTGMGVLTDTDGKVLVNGPDGNLDDSDATLAAAAPDLAETIAEMTYEYAAQIKEGGEWFYLGLYGPDEPWGPEEDVRDYHSRLALPGARLVRRLVGPVEVVEGE